MSAAVVLRSLILRRRHRRLINEVIRSGVWPPSAPLPGRTVMKSQFEKPDMFVANLGFATANGLIKEDGKQKQRAYWGYCDGIGWEEVQVRFTVACFFLAVIILPLARIRILSITS